MLQRGTVSEMRIRRALLGKKSGNRLFSRAANSAPRPIARSTVRDEETGMSRARNARDKILGGW